jgi:hypothetical protein
VLISKTKKIDVATGNRNRAVDYDFFALQQVVGVQVRPALDAWLIREMCTNCA